MEKSVREIIQEVINDVCDNLCKFPSICKTEEELMEHCDECPLNKL